MEKNSGGRMGKRIKNPGVGDPNGVYDAAYRVQVGEFHPEHHQANLRTLITRYPEHSADEIDSIYRQACRIESEIEQWTGGMELSPGSRRDLLEWLGDHFFGFSETTFAWALESVEERRSLKSEATVGPHSRRTQ